MLLSGLMGLSGEMSMNCFENSGGLYDAFCVVKGISQPSGNGNLVFRNLSPTRKMSKFTIHLQRNVLMVACVPIIGDKAKHMSKLENK